MQSMKVLCMQSMKVLCMQSIKVLCVQSIKVLCVQSSTQHVGEEVELLLKTLMRRVSQKTSEKALVV